MPTSQWDMIGRQVASAAHNAAAGGAARARRETSLVGQASRLSAEALRQGEDAVRQAAGADSRPGSRPPQEGAASDPVNVRPAPDGYVRRSPVQPIYESADYHRKIVRRVVNGVAAVIVALALVWLLLRSGILAF